MVEIILVIFYYLKCQKEGDYMFFSKHKKGFYYLYFAEVENKRKSIFGLLMRLGV